MSSKQVLRILELGMPWKTLDPFLFCVHHLDKYPAGDDNMAPPRSSLAGRDIGSDFAGKDGWRMYHGETVPGFPQHPHRGFETVTVVRQGYIDHTDSLGAGARFGPGDSQWVTAGSGVVHSEMFPLLERSRPNPLELFQIWLNLPSKNKMVPAHFKMLWAEGVPKRTTTNSALKKTEVVITAGTLGDLTPGSPPPESWAAKRENDVAIWQIRMEPGADFVLPPAQFDNTNRVLYFFGGDGVLKAGEHVQRSHAGLVLAPLEQIHLQAPAENKTEIDMLLLQGRPIGEPVAQQGPFVMNTREQIMQAFADYQRTRFGGWPWPEDAPVHPRDAGRFAKQPDGTIERPSEAQRLSG